MTEASDLYGLPLDQFIPQRAVLAKALRSAGERDEAARVAKLAKPTVSAWIVNQIVRTQKTAVARLFGAGDALKQAQHDIVEGRRGAAALREASAAKRDALDELMAAARGLLDAQGHAPSESTLTRVSATLDAAALEDAPREQVAAGCLVRELERTGLGDIFGAGVPPTPPAPAPDAPPAADKQAAERDRAEQARREAAQRAAAQRAAVQRAARELKQAQARRDRAAREAQEARAAAEQAHARLQGADEALRAAQDALADARERADARSPDGHTEGRSTT